MAKKPGRGITLVFVLIVGLLASNVSAEGLWGDNPPYPPNLSGPSSGQIGIPYTYYANAIDPEGNPMEYVFDWGDGSDDLISPAVNSGTEVSKDHIWTEAGTYTVTVKAIGYCGISEWSDPLRVVVGTDEQIPSAAARPPKIPLPHEIPSAALPGTGDGEGTITPPLAPERLQTKGGDGYVELSWDAPADDPESPITEYVIYRGTTPGGEKFAREVGNVSTYTDSDVINDQTYYYQVSAVNAAGEGAMSEEESATPTPGVIVPSDPPELKATGGNHEVKLEWKKPEDDGGAPITEYRIYRSMKLGDKKIDLVTVGDMRTYTDKNLKNGQTYYYQVSAVNSAGEGKRSHEAKAIPKPDWAFIAALIAAAATIAGVIINNLISRKRRYGSISATSSPDGARVFLDGVDKGESPLTMGKIRKGTRIVLFSKSGYSDCEKRVVVNADQITPVHCDLKKPEMKLVLSADPIEIPADGKSKSVITISVEDENGTPAPVPEEMTIVLETDIGLIDTPVSIPAGDAQATSILTSSTADGTATVRAKSGTGLKNDVAVRFV
jgi:PKD repeat protein